jgi:hypothetical protein
MISHSHKTLNKQVKYHKNKCNFFLIFSNIFRIIIQVDERTKKTRKTCHFEKRFDLILILNHFGKGLFDCDFKSYFRQMI